MIVLAADEQTPLAAKRQLVLGGKMSIVPRRLSIGNDEYVTHPQPTQTHTHHPTFLFCFSA